MPRIHRPQARSRVAALGLVVALVAAACGGDDTPSDSEAVVSPAVEDETVTPTASPAAEPLPDIAVRVSGQEEIVFDYSEANCDRLARPDLPTRALRTGDQVSMTLAHTTNHRLVGSGFDDLVVSCEATMRSAYDHDPAAHAHHEWLAAVYTEDGQTVHGVVHNEFHGYASELADSRRALLDGEDPGDWIYLARSETATAAMTPTETGYGGGGLCSVEFWGAHPDVGCDAVSRWTSDRESTLVIDLDATKVGVGGDGVLVDVRIDGERVWEATLTDAEPATSVQLSPEVAVGSTIDIGVSAGGDASFDATELQTVITPDGARCTGDVWACTMVGLTAAVSRDGGATFEATTTGPRDLIAAMPGRYEHDAGFAAMWQPSNIVAHPDGSHVMIVQLDEHRGRDAQYSCLLRTQNLADPTAWRAWDGEAFSLPAIDPYSSEVDSPPCARVAPSPISGLVWSTDLELFVAVGGFGQFGASGQYALFSPDLFTWSDPVFIQGADFVFTATSPPFEPYATLIDHDSPAPSFDSIGATPHLYFTRINDATTLDFDLVRVPLEISVSS